MTNYIIDPAVFYWINVLSIIQTVCGIIGALALIGCITLTICFLCQKPGVREPVKPENYVTSDYAKERYKEAIERYNDDLMDLKFLKKYVLITLIVGVVLVIISIFVPGKQTSIEMLVAKTATFDNVDWTVQQVKEVIDYIVQSLKGLV